MIQLNNPWQSYAQVATQTRLRAPRQRVLIRHEVDQFPRKRIGGFRAPTPLESPDHRNMYCAPQAVSTRSNRGWIEAGGESPRIAYRLLQLLTPPQEANIKKQRRRSRGRILRHCVVLRDRWGRKFASVSRVLPLCPNHRRA